MKKSTKKRQQKDLQDVDLTLVIGGEEGTESTEGDTPSRPDG